MNKEEFIEQIKKITYLPNEDFFLEYNNVIYNILDQKEELQQKIDKANEILSKSCFEYDNCPDSVINEIIELKKILDEK